MKHEMFDGFLERYRRPAEDCTPFDPCEEMPCPACDGKLEYSGNNIQGTLAFVECTTRACSIAFVVSIGKGRSTWR